MLDDERVAGLGKTYEAKRGREKSVICSTMVLVFVTNVSRFTAYLIGIFFVSTKTNGGILLIPAVWAQKPF